MERIASFCVDHMKLKKGLYISRVDGDVVTYDLRVCIPNGGIYLENAAIHTVEHLFATYIRNTRFADQIVYVGPMGCRTGFYLLTREGITGREIIALLQETFRFIADYTGEIPGVSESECGNYRDHDLLGAKKVAKDYGVVLADWTVDQLNYAV